MNIVSNYNNTVCYKQMDKKHQQSFDKLVNVYGEQLNAGCPLGDVLYTAHDFNKHCNNIFDIIDRIILKNQTGLSPKEYYILCLSVLFHDISMAVNTSWNRKKHSVESAEYLKKELKNSSSSISQEVEKALLTRNDVKTIERIIIAHSDVKDGSLKSEENGIYNPKLSTNMSGNVNGKLLAAILRLADELDITSDRIGTERFSDQLNENNETQLESKRHWENLHYFSEVKIDQNDTSVLQLCCDDEYISDYNDDIRNIYERINGIKNKIQKELDSLNKEVFRKPENEKIYFHVDKIEIITDIPELKKALINKGYYNYLYVNPSNMLKYENEIPHSNELTDSLDSNTPKVINKDTCEKLNEFIKRNKLFKGGHYLFTDDYCAMDWIDTNEIIETNKICEICIYEFANHILKRDYNNNALILGLDFLGSIIASQLALYLRMPFQCVIPAKSEFENSSEDISSIEFSKFDNIVIVTDVISTYNTILSVITKNKLEEKVKAIYSILYRDPNLFDEDKDNKYKNITNCISNEFPMNIIEKKSCKFFTDGKCIAENKKMRQIKNTES